MEQLWEFESLPASGGDMAVALPGLVYGCDRPLLAGVRAVMESRGATVAALRFRYADNADFMALPEKAQIARIKTDGADILRVVRRLTPARLWLIGKSLGTISMAGMDAPDARHIWLTPSLRGTGIGPVIQARGGFCLIGSRDPARDMAVALSNPPHLTVAEIAGADHSWESAGEDAGDILTPALAAVENWLRRD